MSRKKALAPRGCTESSSRRRKRSWLGQSPIRPMKLVVLAVVLLPAMPPTPAVGQPCSLPDPGRLHTIVPHMIYRVWSDVNRIPDEGDPFLWNHSGMYLFKGVEVATNTWTLYVFGNGYGNLASDLESYNPNFVAGRNAIDDAVDVAEIITDPQCMALGGQTIKVTVATPHAHLDHLNAEFISALLVQPGATFQLERIVYHAEEETLATCQARCCIGQTEPPLEQCPPEPCKRGQCDWYGAPFLDLWDVEDHQPFLYKLGAAGDPVCQNLVDAQGVGEFAIAADQIPGVLHVQLELSNIHTFGPLNLMIEPDPSPGDDKGIDDGAYFSGATFGCYNRAGGPGELGYRHYTQHDGDLTACPD